MSIEVLALHPGEPVLAAGDEAGNLFLWTVPDMSEPVEQRPSRRWKAHHEPVRGLVYARLGQQWELISADAEGQLKGWDPKTASEITPALHSGSDSLKTLARSVDRKLLAASDDRGRVSLRRSDSGDPLHFDMRLADAADSYQLSALAFTGDSRFLVAAGHDSEVNRNSIIDLNQLPIGPKESLRAAHNDHIRALASSPREEHWL